ncbi:MAG: MFS transporter, partial [Oscillospiraceae bacterium]|nr:MFS transporter [Oscillospiraceae bacterium]
TYGLATIFGSVLSAVTALFAGKIYDKMGSKPTFITGTGLFLVFSIMGSFLSQDSSIIYIAVVFALQSIAMSTLNSPATAMALSGLEGKERVDGSAIFNTLRQISSSLASTLSVLIFTLTGSDISAVHCVYVYFFIVTAAVAVTVVLHLRSENKN